MSAELECFVVLGFFACAFVGFAAYMMGYESGYNDGRDAGLRLGYLRGYFDYLLEKSTTEAPGRGNQDNHRQDSE